MLLVLCRGRPSHPAAPNPGGPPGGTEPSAQQGERWAQPGLRQLIRHQTQVSWAALGLLPAGLN